MYERGATVTVISLQYGSISPPTAEIRYSPGGSVKSNTPEAFDFTEARMAELPARYGGSENTKSENFLEG